MEINWWFWKLKNQKITIVGTYKYLKKENEVFEMLHE